MRFDTTVELGGKAATGIEVPPDVVEALGSGKRPAVMVTVNGYTYRSTIASMGGRFMLPLSAENRAGAGVAAGDQVEVDVELDTSPRTVEIPDDLRRALAKDAAAKRRFESLPYSHKKEHVRALESAKKPETRERRLAKTLEMLRGA